MIIRISLLLIDIILINVVFILSFIIRYGLPLPESNFAPFKDSFPLLTFVFILSFAFARLFKRRFVSYWDILKRIFIGQFYGTLISVALMYVFRIKWSSFPSSVFIISFPTALLIFFAVNAAILRIAGRISKKVVIIGKGQPLEVFNRTALIETRQIDTIEDLLLQKNADEVVICQKIQNDAQLNLLNYLLLKLKVSVVFSPTVYAELLSGNIAETNSIRYLATFLGRKSEGEEFLIRALDIIGGAIMLIVFGPLIAIFSILVKLSSPGPVFYKQTRVSKDGKPFELFKFRTMIQNAEQTTGPVLAKENDKRVTSVGRFMRETRIDEIPQVLNVLAGDMSLVGPRPERPHFVKLHKALREVRLAVKPGLTGFAQIRSLYDLHPKHKIKYDYLYIQRRSLLLNLYILAKTIPVVFSKKGR